MRITLKRNSKNIISNTPSNFITSKRNIKNLLLRKEKKSDFSVSFKNEINLNDNQDKENCQNSANMNNKETLPLRNSSHLDNKKDKNTCILPPLHPNTKSTKDIFKLKKELQRHNRNLKEEKRRSFDFQSNKRKLNVTANEDKRLSLSKDKESAILSISNKGSSKSIFGTKGKNNSLNHKTLSKGKKISSNIQDFNDSKLYPFIGFSLSHNGQDSEMEEKINQDSVLYEDKIKGVNNFSMFGIMDGHGVNGEKVSQYIKKRVSEYFMKIISKKQKYIFGEGKELQKTVFNIKNNISNEIEIYEKLLQRNFYFIKEFFKKIQKELKNQNDFYCDNSGSTCLLLFKIDMRLIISNIGDSRLILIKENIIGSKIYSEQVTIDHKPNDFKEKQRILKMGGDVHQSINNEGSYTGPFRIWEKGKDYPGLAISRSIGDFDSEKAGVISDPDIFIKEISFTTKALVLGSDGLFDYMSNDEIANIVMKYYKLKNAEEACNNLYLEASKRFENNCCARDDISIIVLYF